MVFGRALRDGLLGKARAQFHGLGPKGEYPSREDRTSYCHWCDGMGLLWTDASMARAISCPGCNGSGWRGGKEELTHPPQFSAKNDAISGKRNSAS
jgi:hypothetical protein